MGRHKALVLTLLLLSSSNTGSSLSKKLGIATINNLGERSQDLLAIRELYDDHIFFDLNIVLRFILVIGLTLVLTVTIAAKCVLLSEINRTSGQIRVLTLVDQSINFVTHSLAVMVILHNVVTSTSLRARFGEKLSMAYEFVAIFGQPHAVIGSCGIALYRISLIKFNTSIQFWKTTLMIAILTSGLMLTTSITITVMMSRRAHPYHYELYHGLPYEYVSILNDYQYAGSWSRAEGVCALIVLMVNIFEAACYASFFHYLYIHDTNMKRILSMDTIKERHRQNAITFTCEMYCFVFEFAYFLAVLFTKRTNQPGLFRQIVVTSRYFTFGTITVVQAMSTRGRRDSLKKLTEKLQKLVHRKSD